MSPRRALALAGVVALASLACRREPPPAPASEAAQPAAAQAPAPPASGPPPAPKAAPAASPAAALGEPEEPLVEEAPEANPRSETVTIKLIASEARKARVFWGRKDLGLAPLELTRPRNSGPLDLLVVAPGMLPLHTRVFTDRDDKLALRFVAESEGPAMLGYRAEPPPPEKPVRGAVAARPPRAVGAP